MNWAVPPWVTAYRKALVLGVVAVSAGAAGWTVNGWRKGKELAELEASQAQAETRRTIAVGEEWAKATSGALENLAAARRTLAQVRADSAKRLAAMRAAQPQGPEWACRQQPLPETYLEKFRPAENNKDKTP